MLVFLFTGCGYKSTNSIVKNAIHEKVFVDVKTDAENLSNTIFIKDELIKILTSKLDLYIVDNKEIASAIVYGELKSVSETILETDEKGYAKVYRETVVILVSYTSGNQKPQNIIVSNYYDYSITNDSVFSQAKKEEAIKLAIEKALSDVFSMIAINSIK